jgi:hypothetical protein
MATESETTTSPDVEWVREMNRIASDPEGRIALQRAQTGQSLDSRQTAGCTLPRARDEEQRDCPTRAAQPRRHEEN